MRWLLWWRPPCLLRPVIVNMVASPEALQGVLWSSRGPWVTLRGAKLLPAHGTPTTLDGEIVVHRAQILFIQVLP